MSSRYFPFRCVDDDCGWRGDRRTARSLPCPWCGGEVETVEVRRRLNDHNDESDYGLIRPAAPRAPFGITPAKPRLRPWHDGVRVLPNGLRAKVVRTPSLADAFDHARTEGGEYVADVLNYTGWGKSIS